MRKLLYLILLLPSLCFAQSINGSLNTYTASGADTYAITVGFPAAYTTNERYLVRFTNANTGAATLNRDGLGAKAIKNGDGTALSANTINAGETKLISYNGTNYYLVGGSGGTSATGYTHNTRVTDYTLVLSDGSYSTPVLVEMNVAGANTVTVPLNSSVAFPTGAVISISQYGAGTTTIVATGGVTINSSSGSLVSPGQYAVMVLEKRGTNEWYLWNGSAAGGSGTVTSVAATVPSLLSVSGSPVTTSGTLAFTYSGTALPVANGGTNATSAGITAFNNITGYTASGSTGTTSTNLVFSTSPTLASPTFTGSTTITQDVSTSGSPTGLLFTGGAHTTLAASTEASDVRFNLARTVQFATGALATQRIIRITAPTYSFAGASTITDAVTLDIDAAPTAGTNATITRPWALRAMAGNVRLNGRVSVHFTATDGFSNDATRMFNVGLANDATEAVTMGGFRLVNETDGNTRLGSSNLNGYVTLTGDNLVGSAAYLQLYGRTNTTNRKFYLQGGVAANDTDVGVNYISEIVGTSMTAANTTNTAGGSVRIYGGAKSTTGTVDGSVILAYTGSAQRGAVVVGGGTVTAGSVLADFQSTTKAVILTRMTKTQRDAMTPADGMIIYQTDNTPGLRVYNGTNWMRFTETAD